MSRRRERRDYTVAGVAEQETVVSLNRVAQHLVMHKQSRPHRFRIGFPPTSRSLDVGEQERHDARRSAPR
jgi:hypothetical protein